MYKFSCPGCNRSSYTADEYFFSPCPYCGLKFSGKYGTDKRREERIKREIRLEVFHHDQDLEGRTVDISGSGLGIRIFGQMDVPVGSSIDLSLAGHNIRAKGVWIKKLPEETRLGLQQVSTAASLAPTATPAHPHKV